MISELSAAYTSLKTTAQIAQGLLALKTDAAISSKVVELNAAILDTQSQLFSAQAKESALLGRVSELEAKVARLEGWEDEKQRYELRELAPGTLVYRVKPAMQGCEPPHDLCPNCYQEGVKSILQNSGIKAWCHSVTCPKCETTFLGAPANMSVGVVGSR